MFRRWPTVQGKVGLLTSGPALPDAVTDSHTPRIVSVSSSSSIRLAVRQLYAVVLVLSVLFIGGDQ